MSNQNKANKRRKNYEKARNVKNNNLPLEYKYKRLKQSFVNNIMKQVK